MKLRNILFTALVISSTANVAAGEMTWGFKNPSFSGNGYSTHVLSVEQLQFNRKKEIQEKAEAEQARLERELENTTLNKFLKNVESRIYAQLSKQMVDAMFADCADATGVTCATSGVAEIEGSVITWTKDVVTGEISLEVVESDGSVTTITIPGSGEFNF